MYISTISAVLKRLTGSVVACLDSYAPYETCLKKFVGHCGFKVFF